MLRYRKRRMRFEELWFDDRPDAEPVDIRIHNQMPQPPSGLRVEEKRTILIDLARDEDELFGAIKKDSRNEIRRAIKDGVHCQLLDAGSSAVRMMFYDFYDDFVRDRKLNPLDRVRLDVMAANDRLVLTEARDAQGGRCVVHAYLRHAARARLLFSVSDLPRVTHKAQRNLIGRANRLLHWEDMQQFRRKGVRFYDFGGWYAGEENQELLRINRFKEEFGGETVIEYNAIRGVSWRGKLALAAWKWCGGQ